MPGQGRGGLNEATRLFIKQEEKKKKPVLEKAVSKYKL